jgi:hypothetical protein
MSAADLRQRKPQTPTTSPLQEKASSPEDDSSKSKSQPEGPDLEPDIRVVLALVTALITIIVTYYLYRVDLRDHGAFSTFVNEKILGFNPYPGPPLGSRVKGVVE